MEFLTALFNIILLAAFFHTAWLLWENHRSKKIFVIEDSEIDRIILETRIKADNCKVTFFYSCESAILEIGKESPDLVLIDQNLSGKIKGAELLKHCIKFKMDAYLVTAETGEILGVDESYIIRKTYDESYYAKIQKIASEAAA